MSVTLTPREHELMTQVVQGKRLSEIAREWVVSYKTVEGHHRHIMKKLGARTGAHAAALWNALMSPADQRTAKKHARRAKILELITKAPCRTVWLAHMFGVSQKTIMEDLRSLGPLERRTYWYGQFGYAWLYRPRSATPQPNWHLWPEEPA